MGLGDGTTTDKFSFVEVVPSGVQAISAGGDHSMVLKTDGSVWTAGYNHVGQLGDGTTTDKDGFVMVVPSAGDVTEAVTEADDTTEAGNDVSEADDVTPESSDSPPQISITDSTAQVTVGILTVICTTVF